MDKPALLAKIASLVTSDPNGENSMLVEKIHKCMKDGRPPSKEDMEAWISAYEGGHRGQGT